MAEKNERRLELLLGTRVLAKDGRAIGRLEEFHAECEHDFYVVTEYVVGPVGLVERLAARHLGFTRPGHVHGYRVRWDQLDIEDPEHPRLKCPIDQLERVGSHKRSRAKRAA